MKICGMEKSSLVDYDGKIAVVVFTPECNFACPFCQNSSLLKNENLTLIEEKEIFDYLFKRRNLIDAVVISGGEPTLQPDLIEFIKKVKNLDYLVKLDTNGSNFEVLKNLVENKLIDYIAMDIKNSINSYNKTVSAKADIDEIKKSVSYLLTDKLDYEFRTTLVKELHSKNDIIDMSKWLIGAKRLFLQKFKDSENCLLKGLNAVDILTAREYQKILKTTVQNVYLRGY